jgi:hypothetical protein
MYVPEEIAWLLIFVCFCQRRDCLAIDFCYACARGEIAWLLIFVIMCQRRDCLAIDVCKFVPEERLPGY